MPTPIERILSRLSPEPNTGCWLWPGADVGGYGVIRVGRSPGRLVYVCRLIVEHFHGPLAPGLCALHRCDNPPCGNPDHLFVGTRTDNNRDKMLKGRGRGRPRGPLCPSGHEMAGDNLYWHRGQRYCRACRSRRSRAWNAARRVAA